jgi:RNA polymerase sigma factor (sigma-70 family)
MIYCELGVEICWQNYIKCPTPSVRDDLIKQYIPFVYRNCAKKCKELSKNSTGDFEDYMNAAYATLVKSFDTFDYSVGYGSIGSRFTAYLRTKVVFSPVDEYRKIINVPKRHGSNIGVVMKSYGSPTKYDNRTHTDIHQFIDFEANRGFYDDVFSENIFDLSESQMMIFSKYVSSDMSYRQLASHFNLPMDRVVGINKSAIAKIKSRIKRDVSLQEFYSENL